MCRCLVFGQPQLGSSIGSLVLSGEQCPGTLSLTCDARNFGFIDSINWFVGDERVAVFDYNVDSTPFTATTTRPDILNATVQLTTATFTGGQFSFINFTLSASVSNFLSLQGQNISCGNLAIRSLFGIKEFTINNESSSYQGVCVYMYMHACMITVQCAFLLLNNAPVDVSMSVGVPCLLYTLEIF